MRLCFKTFEQVIFNFTKLKVPLVSPTRPTEQSCIHKFQRGAPVKNKVGETSGDAAEVAFQWYFVC